MAKHRKPRETRSAPAPSEGPNLNDLMDNAEAGFARRAIARYLFSRNPERSVKAYTHLGMPLVRKVVMATGGRIVPQRDGIGTNYHTDNSKSVIERSTRFAVGGSVFNEVVHTALAANSVHNMINHFADSSSPAISISAFGVNAALVGLQRYNRARMHVRINEELAAGNTFDPDYTNWLGIDGRAVANYEAATGQEPEAPLNAEPIQEF